MYKTILVVDDEESICQSLRGILSDEGYEVRSVGSAEEALKAVEDDLPDLVLLDIWLPGMDGLEALKILKSDYPQVPVIMMSGHGTIETAVKATKLGAFDFIEKPISLEKVVLLVNHALDLVRLEEENKFLKQKVTSAFELIGQSKTILELKEMIRIVAPTNAWILIMGENGTGKELVARSIHYQSKRAKRPFIEVNCAAIPEELIESELFGHRKGSFTGAHEDKTGKFQKADGGSLFLDEVGDMSLKTQAKVLRALDEQRFEPVGASESVQVDVRVIAATNKNLEEEIERGNFREDLFYRLNVIPFYVPLLKERIEDVPLLADHFLREFTTAYGRKPKELTPEAYRVLQSYHWPGNVRELRNLMERIVIMNPQVRIDARHIPLPRARAGGEAPAEVFGSLHEVRQAVERDYILKKLDETGGNVTRAAELLGLERSNLYRKMKSLGIAPKD